MRSILLLERQIKAVAWAPAQTSNHIQIEFSEKNRREEGGRQGLVALPREREDYRKDVYSYELNLT